MTEVTNTDLAEVLAAYAGDSEGPLRVILLVAAARLREAPSVSDSAGWIEWVPGIPHPFSDQKVDVVLRDGTRLMYTRSSALDWNAGGPGAVVRYRLSV